MSDRRYKIILFGLDPINKQNSNINNNYYCSNCFTLTFNTELETLGGIRGGKRTILSPWFVNHTDMDILSMNKYDQL